MEKYLNPISNIKRSYEHKVKSKKHIDCLVDIKFYVTEEEDFYLRECSRKQKVSLTKYCTNVLETITNRLHDYPKVDYIKTAYMVHVCVNPILYQKIVRRAAEWRCSIREATHRMFQYGYVLGVI
ncbi:hypothetical protein J5Y03_09970 [Bacillus sp. RG28]|uniref:Uncharacterized protein n=1 Tax=Gottfriedia endophytica TaxID=2820819 RepID=A0A940NQ52_9BACI|nr:hypothetical protein [Gottfriedia endophytica]MBP0725513.1 hypothetical protein [Gottfriedia endophytica]